MKVLTFSDTLAAAAKGLGKWCIYVGIHYTIEEEAEILKAAPWLTKLDSFDLTGFIMDGGGIIAFNSEQEMLDAYENTVGEDGPTKTNSYDGPVHIYCLTCDSKGHLQNENT